MTAPRTTRNDEYAHLAPKLVELAAMTTDDPARAGLRDELAAAYRPVVQHIARRYRDRGEPVADLEQVGTIGLLGALERYSPDHGVDFLGFAVPTITGEIKRHFRDRTWTMRVPRRLKDLQVPIRDAVAVLSARHNRAPRPSEIAAHLDTSVEEIIEALGVRHAQHPDSLDSLLGPDSTGTVGDIAGIADVELTTVEYRDQLRRALADLPERERTILVLRFFGGLSQTQIGAQVGVSQMHVSRLLSATLATLRTRMGAA